ncbi:MAG TPA: biotin/lipoyl-containing protein [Dehalococcoidia bacterium]|nr:biotin/lipoyl-containing protein [Dehalococcoidia bacterium]
MASRHRFLIDGTEHSVTVEESDGLFSVAVDDDDPQQVDFTNSGLPGLFSLLVNGDPSQAFVSRRGAGFEVTTGGRRFKVEAATAGRGRRGPVGSLEDPIGKVTAPLGGVVFEVHVKVGDTIATGDPLMVIEAMKMQNEVQAPHPGTVTTLHVNVGDRVDSKGDLLLEYDADEPDVGDD